MSLDQMTTDVMTTAVEGGIGYWSEVTSYRWDVPMAERHVTLQPLAEFEGEFERKRISPYDIRVAMNEIAFGAKLKAEIVEGSEYAETRDLCATLLRDPEDDDATSELDAGHADRIMQVAVMGKVVFG